MNHLIAEKGLGDRITCDSAGTANYHVGASPDRRMAAAAFKRGIVLKGSGRQFTRVDLEAFDLILAMDRSNYQDILALDLGGKFSHKVKMMCDYARRHPDKEVPDPYYGGTEGFNYVIDLLFDACEGLLDTLDIS